MSTIDSFLADVRAEASSLDPVKILLTLLAGTFFVAGWLIGQAARLVFLVAAFAWSAGILGYRRAKPSGGDS